MDNFDSIQTPEELLEQAGFYLTLLDERSLSDEERATFIAWLSQSDSHRLAFEQVASVWGKMDILQGLADIFPIDTVSSLVNTSVRKQPVRPFYWKGALAAFLLLAISLFTTVYYSARKPSQNETEVVEQKYAAEVHTKIGEIETVDLEDGSKVVANTNSRLSISVTKTQRQVILDQGEAFFEVEHDPSRTFDVVVDDMIVRAVGTAFSVYRDDGEVKVVVTEGVVQIIRSTPQRTGDEPEAAKTLLHPGQMARYGNTIEEVANIEKEELARKLSWRQGMLVFEGEPLSQVIEEFSRYTEIQFEVSDDVRDKSVGGYFNSSDVANMLTALQSNFGIAVTYLDADHVLLSAAR